MQHVLFRQQAWLGAVALEAISTPTSVHAETYEVTLEGFSFWYEGMENLDIELAIDPGDTIRWVWVEGFHNVVSGFPDDPDTGELFFSGEPTSEVGTIFDFTFDDPGVFGFHCHPHEELGMVSSITVIPEPGSIGLLVIGPCSLVRWRRNRCHPKERLTSAGSRG